MADRVRVKDPVSKHEFTTSPEFAESASLTVLDKDAVDSYGRDLAPKNYISPSELAGRTVPQLRDWAAESGIDLGEATKKDDIIAALSADTKEK